jgi:hypothetical protein
MSGKNKEKIFERRGRKGFAKDAKENQKKKEEFKNNFANKFSCAVKISLNNLL